MKLSENTLNVLKNFATINQGIIVKPGSTLRTISSNKTILAAAKVEETFEKEFGIYDLNKVLSVIDKNSPEVSLEKDHMVFNSFGKIRVRYTEPSLIMAPPNKNISVPSYDVSFDLSAEALQWIFSMAAVLKCPNIVVKSDGDGGDITISAMDVKGEIVDDATAKVGENCDTAFQAALKVENLKVLSGGYKVEISEVGVSRFSHESKDVQYWIAIEKSSSKFGK